MNKIRLILVFVISLLSLLVSAREYHVSVNGDNKNDGSASMPFRTISAAALIARPGDIIIVHSGIYRERVDPGIGGTSDDERIVYRAADGEVAEIKGSEVIDNWIPFSGNTWKVSIPNTFFGNYNPYKELIAGDWFTDIWKSTPHTGEVFLNGRALYESCIIEGVLNPAPKPKAMNNVESTYTWYCESDETNTYIYANFQGHNPNQEPVEISVRKSCFYPHTTGINFITVSGFHMSQAATQWAPPTSEQVGLIGTNWSKGWIIENNIISDSKCSGVTLGKYGDQWDNKSASTADGYVKTIDRALQNGWHKETIGHHIVRNNTIFNCEQTGICGSLGAVFSQITGNHIYNIYTRRLFSGAEIAGIKIHAAIDVLIKNNCIHNACRGLWMDWMAQGTRISDNICFNNDNDDVYFEVDHGPYLVDNNLFLSRIGLMDMSHGGAFVHNLFAGKIIMAPDLRATPYHKPHSTEVSGYKDISCGDNRFYNNIFAAGFDKIPVRNGAIKSGAGYGLDIYNFADLPVCANGNIYYQGSLPVNGETNYANEPGFDPQIKITEEEGGIYLNITLDRHYKSLRNLPVTTRLLGNAIVPGQAFENPDGTPLKIDTDYSGKTRNENDPSPGPFENIPAGKLIRLKVW